MNLRTLTSGVSFGDDFHIPGHLPAHWSRKRVDWRPRTLNYADTHSSVSLKMSNGNGRLGGEPKKDPRTIASIKILAGRRGLNSAHTLPSEWHMPPVLDGEDRPILGKWRSVDVAGIVWCLFHVRHRSWKSNAIEIRQWKLEQAIQVCCPMHAPVCVHVHIDLCQPL